MDGEQIENICRNKMCLHLERQMIEHVLARLEAGQQSIPVIGCDARTGVPKRVDLTQSHLSEQPIIPAV